jgi:hypothetical protein
MTFTQYVHDPMTWVALGIMLGVVLLAVAILYSVCVDD